MSEQNGVTVFIPSVPTRFDSATKQRVPTIDLNPAARFGTLEQLYPGPVTDIQTAVDELGVRCQEIQPGDYILAVGDVVLIAAAIAYAADQNGAVQLLRWNRITKEYETQEVKLWKD